MPREGTRQTDRAIVVCLTPDVCKTPMGASTPPVPYQIVGNFADSASISPNVKFGGDRAFMIDQSIITRVTGDEPGTATGVVSGTVGSIVEPIEASVNVRVNGKRVVRHEDKCKMNSGNTIGRVIFDPGGSAGASSDITPETPEEENSLWSKSSDWVHGGLDALGFIPLFGAIPDLVNAGIYALEGNSVEAGISAIAAVPAYGDSVKAVAVSAKVVKFIVRKTVAKETAELVAKKMAKEKVRKELAAEAAKSELKNVHITKRTPYRRNMSERRKALLRDANDPASALTKEEREFIKKHKGKRVPPGRQVAHEKPLYTGRTIAEKKKLDTVDNMRTLPKDEHMKSHEKCGFTYHKYPK